MSLSHEIYAVLNIAPLTTVLPAFALSAVNLANQISGYPPFNRPELQRLARSVFGYTWPTEAFLVLLSASWLGQVVIQLTFPPVQAHLWNNIYRSAITTLLGLLLTCICYHRHRKRAAFVRSLHQQAVADAESAIRQIGVTLAHGEDGGA